MREPNGSIRAGAEIRLRAMSTGTPPNEDSEFHGRTRVNSAHEHSSAPEAMSKGSMSLLSPVSWEIEFHKLSASCPLNFNGQLPDGVLNVRTSFQSRPSLIALGSKANSVTKFPVFVQTYSNNSNSGNPNDTHEDADSFLGERKDSTIIIASAAEEETPRRNFDFCQVAVLLSELQLLVGILAVTFAISMHTSPSIPHCYTPHWAGVPLFIAGLMGMGLKCRNWKPACSPLILKVIKAVFSLVVLVAGVTSLTAAVLSISFLHHLMQLHTPQIIPPVNPTSLQSSSHIEGSIASSRYNYKCLFNQSETKSSEDQSDDGIREFSVANMRKPDDCENFLFNVKNYSFMQCVILLIGCSVSVVIIANNYLHQIRGKIRKVKENRVSLRFSGTDANKHLDRIKEFQSRTTNMANLVNNCSFDYPETNSDACYRDENNRMDEHNFHDWSPTTRREMFQLPRFRNSKDGNNVLPGVIVESMDDSL